MEIHQRGTKREPLVDCDPHSLSPFTDSEGNDIIILYSAKF